MGLFSNVDIPKNTHLGNYIGELKETNALHVVYMRYV